MKLTILLLLLVASSYSQSPEQCISNVLKRGHGMVYISETTSPVIPFSQSLFTNKRTDRIFPSGDIEIRDFASFIDPLMAVDHTTNWQDLRECMETNLYGLTVIKIGHIKKAVYVFGFTGHSIVGVYFFAVET